MASWLSRTKKGQELLNLVLYTTETTSPNFCYREDEKWRGFLHCPRGDQNSPTEHASLQNTTSVLWGTATVQGSQKLSWHQRVRRTTTWQRKVLLRDRQLAGENKQSKQSRQLLVQQNYNGDG